MIYRILIDSIEWVPTGGDDSEDEPRPSGTALRGAWTAGLDHGWDELPTPRVHDPRLRFWFTAAGWRSFGLDLCAEARAAGHVVRVIRRKNPRPSDVAYRDRYQLALRPDRPVSATGLRRSPSRGRGRRG